VAVAVVDDLAAAATLDAGVWPSATTPTPSQATTPTPSQATTPTPSQATTPTPSQATIQADAAAALGVTVGDVVLLDERVPLVIVGTWRVDDADAPRWMGDPLWTSGGNDRSVGPIVADDDVWTALGITPQVKWTIAPDIDRLTPPDLGTAAAESDHVEVHRVADRGAPRVDPEGSGSATG